VPIFARKLMTREPLPVYGDGRQTRDFVHVDDVVNANVLASESTCVGAYNVGSGVATKIDDLVKMMGGVSVYLPRRPGEVQHSIANVKAAEQAFGYRPRVLLEDGIGDYLEQQTT
jgi:UDP-glucose 4-epimerase